MKQQQVRVPVPVQRSIEPWMAHRNSKSRRAEERNKEQSKKEARGEEEQDGAVF